MIVVGSTVAAWKCGDGEELRWLEVAEAMREASPVPLEFFCAIQNGYDGAADAFDALVERLHQLGGTTWIFALGDRAWEATSRCRLIGITTGRNLVREYALRDTDATHVLFLDSDVEPDPACVAKLLEIDHPVAGGDVPSYCLRGPTVVGYDFEVQEHWNTAGFLLVRRDVLRQVAWRWDPDTTTTDDPSFAQDVERAGFGRTWVRKDVTGYHAPLIPVEARR